MKVKIIRGDDWFEVDVADLSQECRKALLMAGGGIYPLQVSGLGRGDCVPVRIIAEQPTTGQIDAAICRAARDYRESAVSAASASVADRQDETIARAIQAEQERDLLAEFLSCIPLRQRHAGLDRLVAERQRGACSRRRAALKKQIESAAGCFF